MNIDVIAKEIAEVLNAQSEQVARVHKPNTYFDHSYSVMGHYYKRAVLIEIEPWGELRLKYDCNNTLLFSISKRNLAAHLGFFRGKRIHTGDVKFDQALVVRGYDRQKLSFWLMHQEVRAAILSLVPFNCLDFRENLLQYMTRIILEDIKTDDIAVKMKALNDLAKSLERI
jgi:hypothetical protein